MKITIVSTLGIASLALLFSACGGAAVNSTVNNSAAAAVNKSNTAVVINSNQSATNAIAPVSNAANASSGNASAKKPSPPPTAAPGDAETETIQGQLHLGKAGSYILYVGAESGDYAAYCFANDSEAGRAILAKCKDGDQCEFVGAVTDDAGCKAPGLEADLSARGRISKVTSVKTLGRTK